LGYFFVVTRCKSNQIFTKFAEPNPAVRFKLFYKMLFSINQKELPLVAFLLQEKMHFLSKGFPLPSGAKI
jgi:hypothetical protein